MFYTINTPASSFRSFCRVSLRTTSNPTGQVLLLRHRAGHGIECKQSFLLLSRFKLHIDINGLCKRKNMKKKKKMSVCVIHRERNGRLYDGSSQPLLLPLFYGPAVRWARVQYSTNRRAGRTCRLYKFRVGFSLLTCVLTVRLCLNHTRIFGWEGWANLVFWPVVPFFFRSGWFDHRRLFGKRKKKETVVKLLLRCSFPFLFFYEVRLFFRRRQNLLSHTICIAWQFRAPYRFPSECQVSLLGVGLPRGQ